MDTKQPQQQRKLNALSIRLSAEDYKTLKQLAESERRSMNNMVGRLINFYSSTVKSQ